MNRRGVLAFLLSAAAWPAVGSERGVARIGFLSGGSPYEWAPFIAAFRHGLGEMGYSEGRNVNIDFRWTMGERDATPRMARDLAAQGVDVIVTNGGNPSTHASQAATRTIPIVAIFGVDPVKEGLVTNFDRPGRNITGVSLVSEETELKCLQLIRQIMAKATVIGYINDPEIPMTVERGQRFEHLARTVGMKAVVVPAREDAEIDEAVATFARLRADALFVSSTARYIDRRDRFVALAARYKLPTIYSARAYVEAGGLMSYGVDRIELYHQLGRYTGRILRGESPAEIPVLQPSKFELVINMTTAKAIGVSVPQSLLTVADAIVR